MKKQVYTVLVFALFTAFASAANGRFLNVEMNTQEGAEEQPTEIKLRIPMGLIKAMVPQLEEALANAELDNQQLDLRTMWAEIRNSEPTTFVNIENSDNDVTIQSTEDGFIAVTVRSEEEGNMNIKFPFAVGDLIFSEDALADINGLTDALSQLQGDLLTITGDRIDGRIWID